MRMSLTHNGITVLQCGNAVEMRNGIMFDFYPGLPYIYSSIIINKTALC